MVKLKDGTSKTSQLDPINPKVYKVNQWVIMKTTLRKDPFNLRYKELRKGEKVSSIKLVYHRLAAIV